MSCHTADGYRSMKALLAGRDEKSIGNILASLHDFKPNSPYRFFMPPLVGKPEEIQGLKAYLVQMTAKAPASAVAQK